MRTSRKLVYDDGTMDAANLLGGAPQYRAAMALTILVIWLVFAGRWGSYLGGGGLYVSDLVVAACTLTLMLLSRAKEQRSFKSIEIWCGILFLWTASRLLFSEWEGMISLRDAAPYLYSVLAIVATRLPIMASMNRVQSLTRCALVAHLLWVGTASMAPNIAFTLPIFGSVPVFQLRTDFDSAICGVAAVVLFVSPLRPISLSYLLAAFSAVQVFSLESRSGLLSFFAMAGIYTLSRAKKSTNLVGKGSLASLRRVEARHGAAWIALAVGVPALLFIAPTTATGERFLSLPNAVLYGTAEDSGSGTAVARITAWTDVLAFTNETPIRQAGGVGFGPDFLQESGAATAIEGTDYTNVRSPHNYFIGTYARLGVIGVGLSLIIAGMGYSLVWRVLRQRVELIKNPYVALSCCLVAGIPVASSVGVILESPFGAIPYFVSLGVLVQLLWPGQSRAALAAGQLNGLRNG